MSDKVKAKMSNAAKVRFTSSEERAKCISYGMTGKHHSNETREKLSDSRKGRIVSEETRAKMSVAVKNAMSSTEVRAKISAAKKGKSQPKYRWINSDGDIIVMSKANAAQWHPDYKLLSNISTD